MTNRIGFGIESRELTELEERLGSAFITENDPFSFYRGRNVRFVADATGVRRGVYRGIIQQGYVVFTPYLDKNRRTQTDPLIIRITEITAMESEGNCEEKDLNQITNS